MPHQCVHCNQVYPDASKELLEGCSCGSKFFYYIKKEYYDKLQRAKEIAEKTILENVPSSQEIIEDAGFIEIKKNIEEMNKVDKIKIERDVREIIGINQNEDMPVILDLESVKVIGQGKFEIDIVNLFSKKRPLIYKLEEGKYIIDLASTFQRSNEEVRE